MYSSLWTSCIHLKLLKCLFSVNKPEARGGVFQGRKEIRHLSIIHSSGKTCNYIQFHTSVFVAFVQCCSVEAYCK